MLPNLAGTHLEGFTYLGLGNILLIFLSIIIFFGKKFLHINQTLTFQILRPLNLCFVLFIIWALTTNISILGIEIISVNLPKYLFAILSIFSSTGRFAWPFIYFMIIVSIFFIYRSFSKKVSFSIIISLICIQLLDISFKIFNNSLNEKKSHAIKSNDEIWKTIDDEFKIIRTTFLFNNYGPLFSNFSKILGELENIKTDIILNAAMDRKKAAQVRYNLIENINNEKLPTDTAYIIDNLGHLKQLKKQFSEKNYGFLFRDNFWMVLPGKKELMNSLDINNFNKIKINEMELNKKYNLRFKDDFLGFGWTHNFSKQGVWSEGKNSFLLFKKPPSKKNLELEINFLPYKGNKLENFSTKIFVNKQIYDEINLQKENQIKVVFEDNLKSSEIFIKFEFNNIISPFDILESPDARRLGILLKSIKINEI